MFFSYFSLQLFSFNYFYHNFCKLNYQLFVIRYCFNMYEFLSYNFCKREETQEAVSTAIQSYNYVHYTIRVQWNITKQSSISTIQGIIHALTSQYNSRRKKVSSCQIMDFVYVHISITFVILIFLHILLFSNFSSLCRQSPILQYNVYHIYSLLQCKNDCNS